MQAIQPDVVPLALGEDGVLRVGATRVTLDVVMSAFDAGATPEEIVQQYPSLDLVSTYGVLAYALSHRADVNSYLARRAQIGRQIRGESEQRFFPDGVRERLLARRLRSA